MKHYLYALGAILCWASLPAATGSGLNQLSTPELMFYSFSTAAIYLFVQDLLINKTFTVRFPRFTVSLFGFAGIFFYHYIYYLALERAPLAEGAILATTWSLWIVVLSSILQLRRMAPSILLAALVGFAGAVLVIGGGKELSFESNYMQGYLLALTCGIIWSVFSVGLPLFRLRIEPMTGFTILTAIASAGLFLLTMPHEAPRVSALLSAMYLGCIPLGLSFFLWNRAITGGNMVIIGFLSYLTPPLAVLLVALVHGQKISGQVISGMFIILLASLAGKLCLTNILKKETKEGKIKAPLT
ncbi:DMT family transporter [Desulforhopalus sp. IMCC35007]|uniref:DMT family transporter n=1 Tax=Desulforhopalus sp. IMCC35007 TaxID=2569543 RepID=UPI0010AE1C6E|nr:EamA family transporter [Desulforhopalus sp. IMCC35007]TKB12377.1 EamA/RhaT family transporter [Desulforhopalus sp. IMCC35007]